MMILAGSRDCAGRNGTETNAERPGAGENPGISGVGVVDAFERRDRRRDYRVVEWRDPDHYCISLSGHPIITEPSATSRRQSGKCRLPSERAKGYNAKTL